MRVNAKCTINNGINIYNFFIFSKLSKLVHIVNSNFVTPTFDLKIISFIVFI